MATKFWAHADLKSHENQHLSSEVELTNGSRSQEDESRTKEEEIRQNQGRLDTAGGNQSNQSGGKVERQTTQKLHNKMVQRWKFHIMLPGDLMVRFETVNILKCICILHSYLYYVVKNSF